jgi:hypothetical protein
MWGANIKISPFATKQFLIFYICRNFKV